MKNLFCLTAFLVLFVSCSKDSDIREEESLVGTWEVLRFEDETQNVLSSSEGEEIVITFSSSSFEGTTAINEFGGVYEVQTKNKIFFTESYTSEAGESEFGYMFYDALSNGLMQPLPFEVTENIVKIRYDEGKYMFLRKL